ncbi:hypothetical protein [Streptomyces sp. NPDC091259]|uniref:hypothetical protein n=1 Tax=Streptomyces sp. NPDC091259 TaxID=3365976 RepID=UPI00380CFCFE
MRFPGSLVTITLASVQPVRGLHVYEIPTGFREGADGAANPWRLGHVSGRGLAAFPSRDDALRGAREIGDMTDWTRTPEEIRADPSFDKEEYVDRIVSRMNGLPFPGARKGAEL